MTDRTENIERFQALGRRALTEFAWTRVMTFAATAPVADVERAAKATTIGRWDKKMTRRDAVQQLGRGLRTPPAHETSPARFRSRGVSLTTLERMGVLDPEWAYVDEGPQA